MGVAEISETEDNAIEVQMIAFESIPWKEEEKKMIICLCSNQGNVKDVCVANFMVGEAFARAILIALDKHCIPKEEIEIIGSHGQTIWHQVSLG